MTTADASVRPARAADSAAVAELQLESWRAASALPKDVLDSLDAAQLSEAWRHDAVSPPSPRHRVLVACAGDKVVGVVTIAPSEDADAEPARDGELLTLQVHPSARGQGHGSRLLHAAVDHLRGDGFTRATTWVNSDDDELRTFLTSTGWGPDGSHRTLDLEGDGSLTTRQVRLHTDLEETNPEDTDLAEGDA